MSSFAGLCGIDDDTRRQAAEQTTRLIGSAGIERVRFAWCDLHGITRGKTLMASAAAGALANGVGIVGTLMLKDTSDHTAFQVFEPGGLAALRGLEGAAGVEGFDGFEGAGNLMLLADPASFKQLPWAPGTGWMQGQLHFQDGRPVELDTRRILQRALAKLDDAGYRMLCGLEVEFHIYRIRDSAPQLDPETAAWPGLPPAVDLVHPGYNLLAETWWDMADEPLRIVQDTAQALGLPLLSVEVELGPSQVEAVFQPTDAMVAADTMVLFRGAVKQALRRAGYHASFMCRPPFPNIMSSGWHLHQSLIHTGSGGSAFRRDTAASGTTPLDAGHTLSGIGEHYLAGLLQHARGMAALCTPTVNGYARFQPHALAPQSVLWGRDNRGAALRVIGSCGDEATRIENRIGEPAANPYLYLASQIYAGLDGIARALPAPQATVRPYAGTHERLPDSLQDALVALESDRVLRAGLGDDFVGYFARIKRCELDRYEAAQDKVDFQRREYFSRV